MIAAVAAAAAIHTEAREARLLVADGSAIVAVAPDGARHPLIADADDAAYSPDGTLVAFARGGDLWLANADGSGQRRLAATPNVSEWGVQWTPDGSSLIYTASVGGNRQIRAFRLPTGPSLRIAASDGEEWGATVSPTGRLAFASNRDGASAVYVAAANGTDAAPFSTTTATDIHDLAWSPDDSRLAYSAAGAIVVDDGTTQTPLPAGVRPVWSPTGTRIAFEQRNELASVALDGSDVRQLGAGVPLDWRVVPIGEPKFPNFVQRTPSGLVVMAGARGRWRLGFTSMIDNRGPGVLWLRGARPARSHVMNVRQLVELKGGGVRALPEGGELHYVVAPPHYHWHFLGFDRYELRREGDLALLVRDHKTGFCTADHWGQIAGMAHGPARFLGNCAQFERTARAVEEGTSVGYTDRYPAFFHGQSLDVTKLTAGRYWLVHRANPDFHLRESRYGDNAASLLIQIAWPGGHRAPPRITTLRRCSSERC